MALKIKIQKSNFLAELLTKSTVYNIIIFVLLHYQNIIQPLLIFISI